MAGSYVQPQTVGRKLSGAVRAHSFVKMLTTGTADDVVTQAGAGEHASGICQNGGADKQSVEIDGPGGGSKLQISATVTRGQYLKSDASGYGTPGTTDGDFCPVRAEASGVNGDIIPVFFHPIIITAAE
jgi:hypothetical protein